VIAVDESGPGAFMSRQYLTAGKCVEAVLFGNQPFKRYCANMKIVGKEEYLLAAETLKYADVLQQLCDRCGVALKKLEVIKGDLLTPPSYDDNNNYDC